MSMMKQYDVVTIGEILIDFAPVGVSELGLPVYQQSPGGGPVNMICACANFGLKTAFLGKVGDDGFGHFLKETFDQHGVDSSGLRMTADQHTTLAFVHLSPDGDRSFSFYRDRTADVMLSADEVDYAKIDAARAFHFGSLSLTTEIFRAATNAACARAKAAGCLVSYDPNLRRNLWDNLGTAKEQMLSVMRYADMLKISEEELDFLTGCETNYERGARTLMDTYGIPLCLVTLGAAGSMALWGDTVLHLPSAPVKPVDTTGAGDSFTGGFLYMLLSGGGMETLTDDRLRECLTFANATGSLTTTKKGGVCGLPTFEEVRGLLNQIK